MSELVELKEGANTKAIANKGQTMEGQLKLEVQRVEDYSFSDDQKLVADLWATMEGRNEPTVVVHVNYFENGNNVFMPREIGITAFSVRNGVLEKCFVHLEPVNLRPVTGGGGHNISICNSMGIEKMESFLENYIPPGFSNTPMFCSNSANEVEEGFKVLYANVGLPFEHNVFPLQWLMISLSTCGLLTLAKEERTSFLDVFKSIESVVSDYLIQKEANLPLSFEALVDGCCFNSIEVERYQKLGRTNRITTANYEFHPGAVLGVFFNESEATSFLESNKRAYGSLLSCRRHDVKEQVGNEDNSIFCALSVSTRHVFLILDALLVNFGLPPRVGFHYPRGHV